MKLTPYNRLAKMPGMRIPSNWHKRGVAGIIDQAAGELRRMQSATSIDELQSALDAFCLKLGALTEFVFTSDIRGQAIWKAQGNLFDFQQWLKGRCHALAQLHTASTMIKHAEIELDRHDQQLDELQMSVVEALSYGEPLQFGKAVHVRGTVRIGERAIDTDDGPAVATTYVAPNFWHGGRKTHFVDIAERALAFWRAFDPKLGPSQTP